MAILKYLLVKNLVPLYVWIFSLLMIVISFLIYPYIILLLLLFIDFISGIFTIGFLAFYS
jgi:hypothetical protein